MMLFHFVGPDRKFKYISLIMLPGQTKKKGTQNVQTSCMGQVGHQNIKKNLGPILAMNPLFLATGLWLSPKKSSS